MLISCSENKVKFYSGSQGKGKNNFASILLLKTACLNGVEWESRDTIGCGVASRFWHRLPLWMNFTSLQDSYSDKGVGF